MLVEIHLYRLIDVHLAGFFLVISEKKKENMILDQFEFKNMALRFETSALTTECFDMYSFF